MNEQEKQSGIPCRLVGEDGNIFNLVGIAICALKREAEPTSSNR